MLNYSLDLDQVRAYIREKMAHSHVTTADLARKTGVAKGTLDNFFDGTTKSPTFDKICLIIMALEGSLDEAVGIKTPSTAEAMPNSKLLAEVKESHKEAITAKDEHIAHLKKQLEQECARTRRLNWFLRFFVCENILLLFVFVLDWFNPSWGYFRHRLSELLLFGSNRG